MSATAQDIPTFPEFNVKPIQSIVKITREILRIKSGVNMESQILVLTDF